MNYATLKSFEEEELKIGQNFHAFRFNLVETDEKKASNGQEEKVEDLEFIEEEELAVGSNFHAFRFNLVSE